MAWRRGLAILSSPPTINPSDPKGHWLYDHLDVGYVLKDNAKGTLRYVLSAGLLGGDCTLGSSHYCYADQSGRSMGFSTIVGIHIHETGEKQGEIPNRKISCNVFK